MAQTVISVLAANSDGSSTVFCSSVDCGSLPLSDGGVRCKSRPDNSPVTPQVGDTLRKSAPHSPTISGRKLAGLIIPLTRSRFIQQQKQQLIKFLRHLAGERLSAGNTDNPLNLIKIVTPCWWAFAHGFQGTKTRPLWETWKKTW